jgi:hypothetical protein
MGCGLAGSHQPVQSRVKKSFALFSLHIFRTQFFIIEAVIEQIRPSKYEITEMSGRRHLLMTFGFRILNRATVLIAV